MSLSPGQRRRLSEPRPSVFRDPEAFWLWNGRQWMRSIGLRYLSAPGRLHTDYGTDCATLSALMLLTEEWTT